MTLVALAILTALTAAAAVAVLAAGVSLAVGTTRSPVASLICRLALGDGIGDGRRRDFHAWVSELFEAHARAHPGGERAEIERYRRSLRRAGLAGILLGIALLGLLVYMLTLVVPHMG